MTIAKALGGGLPIGALITGERLADVLAPGDHGSTFAGGPVVAAAAHAALDVLDDPALLARVRELGERLREALRELPGVTRVRGRGLMVAADIDRPGAGGGRGAPCSSSGSSSTRPARRRCASCRRLIVVEADVDDASRGSAPLLVLRSSQSVDRPHGPVDAPRAHLAGPATRCASCWSRTTTATR